MDNTTTTFTINVSCADDSIKEKYSSLALKMADDSEFLSKLKLCEDDKAIYEIYKSYGYTDLSFEDFISQFKESISSFVQLQPKETFELTQEELESIVGGINLYKYFTAVISAIPVTGPFISGISKLFTACMEGQNINGLIRQMVFGRPATVNVGLK